jgi:hypothetical protein
VTKRERDKLMRVSHTLGHFEWVVINLASKLNLLVESLDLHKNQSSFPTFEEVVCVWQKIAKWLKGVNEQASRST